MKQSREVFTGIRGVKGGRGIPLPNVEDNAGLKNHVKVISGATSCPSKKLDPWYAANKVTSTR